MTEIPLTWLITALTSIAAITLARSVRLPFAARVFLCAGFLGLSVIGLLLGVRIAYGSTWASMFQPLVAVVPAPGIYLGLAALTEEEPYPWRRAALWHGLPLLSVVVACFASRFLLADVLLPSVSLVYAILLIRLALRPDDGFVHVTGRDIPVVRAALLVSIAFFLISVVGDAAILLALSLRGPDALSSMIGGAASIFTGLIFVTALIGVPMVLARRDASAPATVSASEATPEDADLLARFEAMLEETRHYTDNGLTLARAARRLGVPARALSGAVNRVAGTNVSRHVNRFRVGHAQRLLRETDLPVTEVMLEAGFLSKSTFNTEFRRITGQTPSAFRAG